MMKLYAAAAGTVEYRYDQRGDQAVLMMHGGHMRAELPGGEEYFAWRGYSVVTVSRPGYGRTSQSLHQRTHIAECTIVSAVAVAANSHGGISPL